MPFVSRRAQLRLGAGEMEMLTTLSQSRSESAGRVQRASMLLRYHAGDTVSEIARALHTNRPRVERCVSKALDLGAAQALVDLPGRGRRPAMTAEARAWVVSLACRKPKDLGYAQKLWTTRVADRACPQPLRGGRPSESRETGARNGLQNSARQPGAAPQDSLLPGAARSRF